MTVEANGAQIHAATASPGSGPPYGGAGVGASAPPPPPPTEIDGLRARLIELEELANLQQWVTNNTPAAEPSSREPAAWLRSARELSRRHMVALILGGAVVATCAGIVHLSPRLNESQVADRASQSALAAVIPQVNAALANNRADATTVVKTDPFSVYGLDLSENAKTAIGYVGEPPNVSLNEKRAEYVAKQVRVLSASVKLLDLRLTSMGPNDLRVTTNVAEGFALFNPPATRAPDATPATTATSAP